MAIFREQKEDLDRSARDRLRHQKKIREAIKENIPDIVADHSIIGKQGKDTIRIPVKGIKEYRFIFGHKTKGIGAGDGGSKKGDILRAAKQKKGKGRMPGPGSEPGEDIYETSITIEELTDILFEDLMLPDMERKKLKEIVSKRNKKVLGYKRKGIPVHLAKRISVTHKIKRKKASQWEPTEEEPNFPWRYDDIRYRRKRPKISFESNAVVIFIMDTSGSMDTTKKYFARSFCFLLYKFLMTKYENVHKVFVSHTTTGKEVDEDTFFHKGESGGTYISSGFSKAREVIEERYHPENWNIYIVEVSDGENFPEDNEKCKKIIWDLCQMANLIGFVEIKPEGNWSEFSGLFGSGWAADSITDILDEDKKLRGADNFVINRIKRKEEIWDQFKAFLNKERTKERRKVK